jgi:hypothetical protein
MVSLFSLVSIAVAFLVPALLVARLRRLAAKDARADLVTAWLAALATLGLAIALYALSVPLDASPFWREAGSWVLVAAPVASTVSLRLRGRRSMPRALVVSAVALALVIAWLTLRLKGIRGGWTATEIVATVTAASAAVASAACLGWWSRRARRR